MVSSREVVWNEKSLGVSSVNLNLREGKIRELTRGHPR